jgi:hypothetical protein
MLPQISQMSARYNLLLLCGHNNYALNFKRLGATSTVCS